jgi:hypothetical protein
MSTLEDRLRDAFRADADLVRPDSIPAAPLPRPARNAPGRPRSRRTRVLIPLAAAAGVIAIVAGLSLAAPQRGASRPAGGPSGTPSIPGPTPSPPAGPLPKPTLAANASQGVPASTPAPGVPRFYVTVYLPTTGAGDYIVVRDTATGQVTGRINAPGGAVFAGLAATGGDRTFITTIQAGSGCSVQLYQFQLNQRGAPGPLEPLHITLPSAPEGDGDLAIAPDGRTIAYESGVCNNENEVGVINLATRQARVWAVPLTVVNGAAVLWPEIDVSLSADGGLLGYATTSRGAGVLPTSAPAGSLFARSRHLSGTVIWQAVAGDGDALYGCSISPYSSGGKIPSRGTLTYSRISLTGGGEHVIASWPDVTGTYCYASLDPAGNYLLVQFPAVHGVEDRSSPTAVNLRTGQPTNIWSRPVILNLRTGQLTNVNAPVFDGPFDIAW